MNEESKDRKDTKDIEVLKNRIQEFVDIQGITSEVIGIVSDFLMLYYNEPGIEEIRNVLCYLEYIRNNHNSYEKEIEKEIIKIKAIKKTLEKIREANKNKENNNGIND